MTTTPNQQYLRIYLATWDHKHGQDISAHTTNDGAFKQCVKWARETLEEWTCFCEDERTVLHYEEMNDEELVGEWGELTGYSEFFKVDSLSLNEDEPCEKEKWIADTSHIGA